MSDFNNLTEAAHQTTKALWHEAKGTVRLQAIRIRELEEVLTRRENLLRNIAEEDPNWTVAINHCLNKPTALETSAQRGTSYSKCSPML